MRHVPVYKKWLLAVTLLAITGVVIVCFVVDLPFTNIIQSQDFAEEIFVRDESQAKLNTVNETTSTINLVNVTIPSSKYNTELTSKRQQFKVTLSADNLKAFKDLIKTFSRVIPSDVSYFMYSGTLIGSYRHHGMIPWDDDLDLLVRGQDKNKMKVSLASLPSEYAINTMGSHSWKVYHKRSKKTKYSWNWPFLDIFFYDENTTHIWDTHPSWRYKKYLKADMFPQTKRPFMGLLLPAPRNISKVLSNLYDIDMCETKFYDHQNEKFMDKSSLTQLPCNDLKDLFPFVEREYFTNKIIETLVDNSNTTNNSSTFTVQSD